MEWYAQLAGKPHDTLNAKLEQVAKDPYGHGSFAKVDDPPTRLRIFYSLGFRFEYVVSLDDHFIIHLQESQTKEMTGSAPSSSAGQADRDGLLVRVLSGPMFLGNVLRSERLLSACQRYETLAGFVTHELALAGDNAAWSMFVPAATSGFLATAT